ncbi:MAG: universal stress protein [Saprospiraceae bacterium]|nr:universal stress protein [Saprospiraceae bacterium]
MKKILVPTDFSECANNALAYAVDIANTFGSTITLLHTYQVYSKAGSFISVESFMKEDATNAMLELTKNTGALLKNNAQLESKIIEGDTIDIVMDLAQHYMYDLIVMGTQGASGLEEVFIGSTANNIIKNIHVPVLVVPAGFAFRPIQTIVLAVDEEEDFSDLMFFPLVQIAQSQAAMLRIYHKDVANDGLNAAVDKYLKDIERTYHYELDADNINESINAFIAEYNADLLCMIRRRRGILGEVFHESITAKEVFNSPVPLLVLQES